MGNWNSESARRVGPWVWERESNSHYDYEDNMTMKMNTRLKLELLGLEMPAQGPYPNHSQQPSPTILLEIDSTYRGCHISPLPTTLGNRCPLIQVFPPLKITQRFPTMNTPSRMIPPVKWARIPELPLQNSNLSRHTTLLWDATVLPWSCIPSTMKTIQMIKAFCFDCLLITQTFSNVVKRSRFKTQIIFLCVLSYYMLLVLLNNQDFDEKGLATLTFVVTTDFWPRGYRQEKSSAPLLNYIYFQFNSFSQLAINNRQSSIENSNVKYLQTNYQEQWLVCTAPPPISSTR